jgi:sulfide:quinone oxidoreductase
MRMAKPPGGPIIWGMQPLSPLHRSAHSDPRIVIAGGGVAALETLLALRALAEDRVAIDLLTPEREFVYRPMVVAEVFGIGEEHRFDLVRVCEEQGVRLIQDGLASVDPARHQLRTSTGGQLEYSALVVARGARPRDAVQGAVTFAGRRDVAAVRELLDIARDPQGGIDRIAFAAPGGLAWVLPLYELALMTRAELDSEDRRDVEITLVSPEDEPLGIFGELAAEAVAELLDERRIELALHHYPSAFHDGGLDVVPHERIEADAVIALPWLEGPCIDGLPSDDQGFIPADQHGAVTDVEDVFVAGDASSFPVKQGGLASQQADAVAEFIAARAGADLSPTPFRPVLRGVLLTGGAPTYLRAEISGGRGVSSVSNSPLWWPPAKIAGRYLAPYLALRPGLREGAPLV